MSDKNGKVTRRGPMGVTIGIQGVPVSKKMGKRASVNFKGWLVNGEW